MIFICFDSIPPDDVLEAAAKQNSDGAGIGWAPGDGKCNWRKGITLEAVKQAMEQIQLPFIIHFRKATIGGNSKEVTHPFQVAQVQSGELSGASKYPLLFHNGTWKAWKDAVMKSVLAGAAKMVRNTKFPWSDSRAIAWLAAVHGTGFIDFVDIESGRVVILPPDRSAPMEIWGTWETEEEPGTDRGWWSSRPVAELFASKKVYTAPTQHGYFHVLNAESGSGYEYDTRDTRVYTNPACKEGSTNLLCPMCDGFTTFSGSDRIWCKHCVLGFAMGELRSIRNRRAQQKLLAINDDSRDALSAAGATTSAAWSVPEMRVVYKDLKKRIPLLVAAMAQ